MVNSSSVNSRYTQESNFEQAINHQIAELWQQRNDGYIKSSDKKSLYWCSLTSASHTKAIVVVNGRIESAWKYQELFYDLYQQGYDIYSFDHRGQGLSDRLIDDKQMGYVDEFDDYLVDLAAMVDHFKLGHYQKRYLLAHSMGGAIATRYLETTPQHSFDAIALSAPMYGINVAWYLRPITMGLSQLLTEVHATPNYAPGHKAYYAKPFKDSLLTQSAIRYHWFRDLYEKKPELKLGGPSTRWVWQGLMAAKQCIQQTRQIHIPLLLLQAGNDQIVSNTAQEAFFTKLNKTNHCSQIIRVAGSKHELLFEQDRYRNQTLDALFNFFKNN